MNAKIYNGNVQPNPKEFKIWVNDEGVIKTWNGTEWIEQSGGSGSGNGDGVTMEYFKIDREQDYETFPLSSLPLTLKVKQIYQNEGATYDKTLVISAVFDGGGRGVQAVACCNTSLIVGGITIKESNWKETAAKYISIIYDGFEDSPSEQDVLNGLNYLVPITEEEFYTMEYEEPEEG